MSREDRLSEVERQTDTLDTLGPCEEEYVVCIAEGKEAEKWEMKWQVLSPRKVAVIFGRFFY